MLQTSEFRQHWSTIREKLKDHWQQLTESDLSLDGGEINSVIEKIARCTGASRESVEEFVRQSAEDMNKGV